MRSFVYQCEFCGQVFNMPMDDTHAVPHLNVKALAVSFSYKGSKIPVGAQGPRGNYDETKWVSTPTGANNNNVGERHFCSGKCLGSWVDVQIKNNFGGQKIDRRYAEAFTFVSNGYRPEDFGVSSTKANFDARSFKVDDGDDF